MQDGLERFVFVFVFIKMFFVISDFYFFVQLIQEFDCVQYNMYKEFCIIILNFQSECVFIFIVLLDYLSCLQGSLVFEGNYLFGVMGF